MKRGDLLTMAGGPHGKPRPAIVVQSDGMVGPDTVIVCQITSAPSPEAAYRIAVHPGIATGLRLPSWIMVDKITFVRRSNTGPVFGRAPEDVIQQLDRALRFALDIDHA